MKFPTYIAHPCPGLPGYAVSYFNGNGVWGHFVRLGEKGEVIPEQRDLFTKETALRLARNFRKQLKAGTHKKLDTPVSGLGLSIRAQNVLSHIQINTVGQILERVEEVGLKSLYLPSGPTSKPAIKEIRDSLLDLGIKLSPKWDVKL